MSTLFFDQVDCIVTSAGGIEEDFIKCLAPTYVGDFALPGKELRLKGINRIGNLLVPNSNYCLFENWLLPILDNMVEEQKEVWRDSSFILYSASFMLLAFSVGFGPITCADSWGVRYLGTQKTQLCLRWDSSSTPLDR